MLVLTTMFVGVSQSLPKTSSIKMVDYWLVFNLLIPFVEVLIHTYEVGCFVHCANPKLFLLRRQGHIMRRRDRGQSPRPLRNCGREGRVNILPKKRAYQHIIEHRGACLNCEIFTPAGRTRPSPPWKLGPRNLLILRHTTTLSPSARMFRSEIELNYVIAGCPCEIMTDTENAFEIALFATFH